MFIITVIVNDPSTATKPQTPFLFDDRQSAKKWFEDVTERMALRGWERTYSTTRFPGQLGALLQKNDLKIIMSGQPADEVLLKEHYKGLPNWGIKLMLELAPN